MDREHVKGAADKAKGSVKQAAGKLTGDKEVEREGQPTRQKVTCTRRRATSKMPLAMPPIALRSSCEKTTAAPDRPLGGFFLHGSKVHF